MRLSHFHQLQPHCLACRSDNSGIHSPLQISHAVREATDDILEGLLRCSNPACQYEYPIIDGIPFLLPNLPEFLAAHADVIRARTDLSPLTNSVLGDCCGPESGFNVTRQHLSSYGWCHYGDMDPDNVDAEAGATAHVLNALPSAPASSVSGPAIDLGCSVGRATFELAASSDDLVLGIDLNIAMLRLASTVLREGRVRYPLRRVGVVYDERDFAVQFDRSGNVDFWACDATMLPFDNAAFADCLSLSTLDSVPSPVGLLESMARVISPEGRVRIACPYDWSSSVTPIQGWIGGHSQRADHGGLGENILQTLLTPPSDLAKQLQLVAERDDIPWIVRVHDRSRMSYRLHAVELRRMAD